jgi:hypothetical protein
MQQAAALSSVELHRVVPEKLMTTWNYRVMKFVDEDGEPYHQVHEVYYDAEGYLNGYTENPVSVFSNEGIEGLSWVLGKMADALKMSVLEESDFAKSAQSSLVTQAGENIFLDLGFPPVEAAVLKAESDEIITQKLRSKKIVLRRHRFCL